MEDPKWGIKLEDIRDECVADKYGKMYRDAKSVQEQRTKGHKIFSKVSHMQTLFEDKDGNVFSEGSSQAIKRKVRAQTIQRVPDGEIDTQYDKNSIEQAEIDFLFKNKILTSEIDGKDMLKNLCRAFNMAWDYGNACVRTDFEEDLDGDMRVTFDLIHWNDVLPAPDCDYVEEAPWYMVREYISKSDLWQLLDRSDEDFPVLDDTYEEDTIKYLIENEVKDGVHHNSLSLADVEKGVSKIESIEVLTLYKRGCDEFVTFVPSVQAVLRRVKNEDPRKDIPLHFMVLEPDADFPLGVSSVMYTLGQQQFADAFQTLSYQTLLMATQPPLMGFGNLTPSKIKMKPRSYWPMGTNPNNKIEKFPVETTTLTQYGSILQNVSANMMKNLNVTDSTIASDAHAMTYSGTPQGVVMQQKDKTITVNTYQKRVEVFFAEWANHALRSYINSMGGIQEMTVDEQTRRKVWAIEKTLLPMLPDGSIDETDSIIHEDKISIDFDALQGSMFEFKVRAGSLIESEKEAEQKRIQELLVPVTQMMGALSDDGKKTFERVIMQLVERMCELSNIDISASTADEISNDMLAKTMEATMEQVLSQRQAIQQMQQILLQLASGQEPGQEQPQEGQPEQGEPPQQQPQEQPTPGMERLAEVSQQLQ